MTTLSLVELRVLGPLQVRQGGVPVAIPGAKPRAILTMLGLHIGSAVAADTLVALLWGEDPPRTAVKALQTHISSLRRTLGDGFVLTEGAGWTLADTEVDTSRYKTAAKLGRDAAAAGDCSQAVARFDEALTLWRGVPELPDRQRGLSEKTRWMEGHAALVEDRADALLATGRAAEIVGELEAAVAEAPLRERRWGQLILALYRAGRQGDALSAYQRARSLLADELGVDPGPELRRLEAAIVAQDAALEIPAAQNLSSVTRAVTFLLTDIEGSTAAWEADASAMAPALARHDELVEQVVTSRGGRLIKTRGEGDATFSVFERPSAAAAAAIELQEAIVHEPWALQEPMRIRVALHTGEVELRDGDYFGRAVNRAARLRSLAAGGQILCSGATAELVIDSLSDDVALVDLGMRQLKNLARQEHVFELRLETSDDVAQTTTPDAPMERPDLPAVLTGPGPFVGRGSELTRLMSAWQAALLGGMRAVLIAGEPGVGKTRLAGEWSGQAYEQGAVVLYGRCDEDLGAPYQPFAEALRSLVPSLGASRLRRLRGVEALLPLVPGLTDVVPDLAAPTRADPDTERYALFDAVGALLEIASTNAPVVLILDDLHWAAKPTLLLLRHLLRFGERARVQIIGTYRSTDLDRSHPLAAMLADLHRDGTANRLALSGLDEDDVSAYVAEAGYDDDELARALATVTGGNPFFLIEALRHVDESGGVWDQSTLPQGVREAVSRRLSRLPVETNKALAAAAVVGSRFSVELVERVVDQDLVDAFDEACKAGIVIEEPGGRYRFNHALVRQSLLAELPSVRRMRLHQRIAATLETQPGAEDELLAELAHHYFECAWAGNAAKAVEYCRRAADQAMARLAYEGAADLYDHAVHALEELDDELPDRDDQAAELLIARCEALLAAGDVGSAAGAVAQLQEATMESARLAAWATCFDGQLSMLIHPERLDEVETALGAAADKLAELDDAAGEAKAHTVRASCLARLGRIGDCEIALDDALTAARRAREHRRVNAVLAGAPLAALWGPNPVPRAGGRCLDVVRLLRITTDSPAVEATSTRCQAVLEAFRGRAAAARRMIDSARRTVTELGLRHALLEVEQFAGIVELVADDPAAAEQPLRKAYKGFRRMGLDADTAETAALLGRTCLALDRADEADELCSESEQLAGNALKASIAWRTLRAQLLSRRSEHEEARRFAEQAVALAASTDLLVDHGDACLSLATVLGTAGETAGAQAAAEQALDLYERKGAAALAEMACRVLGEREQPADPAPVEAPRVEPDNACVRRIRQFDAAINSASWTELGRVLAPVLSVECRRKIVGFPYRSFELNELTAHLREYREEGAVVNRRVVAAIRGERLALTRLEVGTKGDRPDAPRDELLQLISLDEEGQIALQVWFDVEDLDAAMAELDAVHARFEAEGSQARIAEPDTACVRTIRRTEAAIHRGAWDEVHDQFATDGFLESRRKMVGFKQIDVASGDRSHLRLLETGDVRVNEVIVIAVRGERLALTRLNLGTADVTPGAPYDEILQVIGIDEKGRIALQVSFDVEDIDAAVAELDARFLAGEAAAHAQTWSVITAGYAALSRHELPSTTGDFASIDHRRVAAFAPGELIPYLRAGWEVNRSTRTYAEFAHRLDHRGAVVTHAAHLVSREGFEAEWRSIDIVAVRGDQISRVEIFDEADLDAALARFDELCRPAPNVENAASHVSELFQERFVVRDWDAMAQMVTDDVSFDDRRRVVNADLQIGRALFMENFRIAADLGAAQTLNAIAIRGDRLALSRARFSRGDGDPEEFALDLLHVIEIDVENRVAATVTFDVDDFDAAIAELEIRYCAGEAAPYAHTWSTVTAAYAALNRRELPAAIPKWVNIDHRPFATIEANALTANIRAFWDLTSEAMIYIPAVHRLNNFGAVVTHATRAISHEGLETQSSEISLLTFEGDLVNRCEIFDEADLDAGLARFDELRRPASRLENAASQLVERYLAYWTARDWDAMAEMLADDLTTDDRRHVINAGVGHGRDTDIATVKFIAEAGTVNITPTVLATRGERLVLARQDFYIGDGRQPIQAELLDVTEINAENQLSAHVQFDPDDIGAALAELDARYVAGEAADHARAWSVLTEAFAAINRHELPRRTPDWVNIDHRRGAAFAPGDAAPYIHALWEDAPDLTVYIEAVHRLSDLGVVVTQAGHGTSHEGFEAEWREIGLFVFAGDLLSHYELFDEADLDAALTRFEELHPRPQRLENAASQASERVYACFAARDWAGLAEVFTDDICLDDRRKVVGTGVRRGREVNVADVRAMAEIGAQSITPRLVATRGERLVLGRVHFAIHDQWTPEDFHIDALRVVETGADNRICAVVFFDPDDLDAALAELDARYLAGEASAHAETWSTIVGSFAAVNRHALPKLTADWVNIDHRRAVAVDPGDMTAYILATLDDAPGFRVYIEAVHRLTNFGAVVTQASYGTSQHGFDAEWRMLSLSTVDGDLINRGEIYDEDNLDAAIARFNELDRDASG